MARVYDRIKIATTTTGTAGTMTLGETLPGFRSFNDAAASFGSGHPYVIEDGSEWEIGLGNLQSTYLTRATVLASSNGGARISLSGNAVIMSAMTKEIFEEKLDASAYTAADVFSKVLTLDGADSQLDADKLDGQEGSYYSNIIARLGYTPVREDGGSTLTGPLKVRSGNQIVLKAVEQAPSVVHRADGGAYYILLTASSTQPVETFNHLRPLVINLTNGLLSSQNGQDFSGGFSNYGLVTSRGTGSIAGHQCINNTAGRDYRLIQKDDGALYIIDQTAGAERLKITPAGDVLINGSTPVLGQIITTVNLDTLTANGVYHFTTATNGPVGVSASQVLVMRGTGSVTQIIGHVATGNVWVRTGTPPSAGGAGSWNSWKQLATTGDTLGYQQTWQNVRTSRAAGTIYQNDTSKPIQVSIQGEGRYYFQVGPTTATMVTVGEFHYFAMMQVIVPPGHYYRMQAGCPISWWTELR